MEKDHTKAATDQDLLMAIAQGCRLTNPAVKAILEQREEAATKKTEAADARAHR